jgi:hypothetical protein
MKKSTDTDKITQLKSERQRLADPGGNFIMAAICVGR